MLNLKSLRRAYNERTRSYADVLPWFRPLTSSVILNTDGSLLAGFEVHGLDLESSDEVQLDASISAVETALNPLDEHCVVWSFTDKRRCIYTGDSTIPNPVARMVDENWRQQVDNGGLRIIRQVIFIAYQPFEGAMGFFDEVGSKLSGEPNFFKAASSVAAERLSRRTQIERMEGRILATLEQFEELVSRVITTLSTRLGIGRLSGDKLLAELSNRANVSTHRETVSVPNNDFYTLNAILPTDTPHRDANGLLRFEGALRTKFVRMLSVKGYPGLARNSDIEQLLVTPADFTVVQMYRFLDQEKAKSMISDAEQHYRSNIKSPVVQVMEKLLGVQSDRVNSGQEILANDAQSALAEATAENVSYGYHSMAIQILGDTPEDIQIAEQMIGGHLTAVGYGLVKETINVMSAFALTLPGASNAVTRSTLISTRNLADITLVRTISAGENVNRHLSEQQGGRREALTILPTVSDVPEMFNLHVGDVGHFMIVGGAGNGKTTFVNFLLMMWSRYAPCRVIAIDKDYSNYITINALGGGYVDLRATEGNKVKLNPARWVKDQAKWPRLRQWLELALRSFDDTPLTPQDVEVLDKVIRLASESGSTPTLSLIWAILSGQSKDLGRRLAPWTRQSERYGVIFDNEEDQFSLNDVTGIEVGGLLHDEHLAPALLTYLFGVIEETVDAKYPTLIYLEEAWYLLRNEAFRSMFEDWIKTMRKRNCCVGLATQSVADIKKSPISATLNDNIRTRIFLPNIYARDSEDVYCDMMNLRRDELGILAEAVPKRQYYVVQDNRRRLIELPLPPDILALTRSDQRAKALFNRAQQTGQPHPEYVYTYLKEINRGHQ